jgi:hypothetical protein
MERAMKKTFVSIALALLLVPAAALAFNPELHNEDGKSYDYDIVCGGSTTHSKIGGHTTTSLGSGSNCTLKVQGAGSSKLAPNMKCTIKGGSLSCK